jgi:hypothetical protein
VAATVANLQVQLRAVERRLARRVDQGQSLAGQVRRAGGLPQRLLRLLPVGDVLGDERELRLSPDSDPERSARNIAPSSFSRIGRSR